MAGQSLNFRPTVLNLLLYTGDGFSIRLVVKDAAGAPIDITGTITAQIRVDRLHPEDSPLATFSVSLVDAYQGIVGLTLTADQTLSLPLNINNEKFQGVWDVQWAPVDRQPRTLVQGTVECVPDVTR